MSATPAEIVESALQGFLGELLLMVELEQVEEYQISRELVKISLLSEWENYAE